MCSIEYYVVDGVAVGESHFTAAGNKTLGIRYTLDENNTVIGFTTGGVNYYFSKNLQGDVLEVYNASTNEVVAQYTYDSWGNILSATGSMAETNPFRYRGYYYDMETGFYYLQSRYYDAGIGRFINADVYSSTGQGILGYNMFAYCNNNPSNAVDPTGYAAHIADRCTFVLYESEEEAAIAAGIMTRMATNRSDNEYICGVYALAYGGYSIGKIYQGEHASASPSLVLEEAKNYTSAKIHAMVHSHPYCNGHIPNEFSKFNNQGEIFGDLKCALVFRMPMYLAAPNGELKVLIPFLAYRDGSHDERTIYKKLPIDNTIFICS